jgi:penicillin-binding protein-related factor A (putative recombinase)
MCGGDCMVEIEVVVVDIFYKKSRKRYTGVASRPQYIMTSKIPLPSMCITTNQLLHLFCIHRIRDICFSIFQSLILSWYYQLTFKKIILAGATNWFTYLLNSIWLSNVIY